MSERSEDRHGPIIAFAVTVFFLIFALIGWYEGFKRGQESHQGLSAEAYTEQAEATIQKTCLVLSDAIQAECIGEAISNAREQQRAEEDLDAQQQMAEWARWMLISTVVMGVITALGVVFVWQTLEATRQMALDTRRIGEAQVRAYLTVEDASVTPEISGAGRVFWHLKFTVRNSGQSPASKIQAKVTGRLFKHDHGGLLPDLAAGGAHHGSMIVGVETEEIYFVDTDRTKVVFSANLTVTFADVFTIEGKRNKASTDLVGIAHLVDGEATTLSSPGTALTDNYHQD